MKVSELMASLAEHDDDAIVMWGVHEPHSNLTRLVEVGWVRPACMATKKDVVILERKRP